MIKRKLKFAQTNFEKQEPGERNYLMQDAGKYSAVPGGEKPLTLDEKIGNAEKRLHSINKSTTEQEALAIKTEYNALMEQKKAEIQANVQSEKNKNDAEIAYERDRSSMRVAEIGEEGVEANAKAQLKIAQIPQGPNEISQTEMDVFNIIKKYDLLKDPEAFKNLVNTTAENAIKTDAVALEKDLVKLGAHLRIDGKIDQNIIDAVESLISKNAPAIKAYKEVTGIDPIRPSDGGAKPAIEKDGR